MKLRKAWGLMEEKLMGFPSRLLQVDFQPAMVQRQRRQAKPYTIWTLSWPPMESKVSAGSWTREQLRRSIL